MLGILLIHKPDGITSHDVVDVIRRRFGTRRVGHAGTLDPMATGLLVVAVGPATRFLQYLPLEPKEYAGEIAFGAETTTQDREGDVVSEQPPPADLAGAIAAAQPNFLGLIQQLPPMFSAVKKNGKPLYVLARQGETIEREPRTVHIGAFDFDFSNIKQDGDRRIVPFRVVCSGGTYVRTLAHDLGRAIGCGAHLVKLQRTAVGRFTLDQATMLNDIAVTDLMQLEQALPPMPILSLNATQATAIRQGQAIGWASPPAVRNVALAHESGEVFGIAAVNGIQLQPECVLPLEAAHGHS